MLFMQGRRKKTLLMNWNWCAFWRLFREVLLVISFYPATCEYSWISRQPVGDRALCHLIPENHIRDPVHVVAEEGMKKY
jgi:hypothetical protein